MAQILDAARRWSAEAPEDEPCGVSDDELAREFTRQHGDDLRYVNAWGRWLRWRAGVWRFDETLNVLDRARAICRERAATVDRTGTATRVASANTAYAVLRLAMSDPVHARETSEWDAQPWLLNTPSGSVDLRCGVERPHSRDDLLTKSTAVMPVGECPQWLAFLCRVTAGDAELQAFLQRMAGYGLAGTTREHALFFLYGTGGNGKGVYVNTLTGVLGDYATVAPIDTFTMSSSERHPTDLAMLRGARLVVSQETEEGRRWAENRIKALTGGDPVSARFMRQDFFTFTPQFKLVVAGNHKPGLRNVDEAMRRRLHLVPFTVTIPAAERDLDLPEKLKAEWGGILRWAIAGCLAWQERGLDPPERVRAATEDYFAAEDALQRWIDAACVVTPNITATTADLFGSWKEWSTAAGEWIGTERGFVQRLDDRGFRRVRSSRQRGIAGLGLLSSEATR